MKKEKKRIYNKLSRLKLVAMLLVIGLFSGCTTSLDATTLIKPPKLTADQSELYSALEDALGSHSFKLKYPLRGDYRSAFILKDLDYNGTEEAVAFYELSVSGVSSTWMAVLAKDGDRWYPSVQVPAISNEVDFISFAKVTQSDKDNIIVGYADSKGENLTAAVYLYNDGKLPTMYTDDYNELITMDFSGNGLEEIVLFNLGYDRSPAIRLAGYSGGRITKFSDVMLPNATKSFYSVGAGKFADGLSGVYADIMLDNKSVTTIIAMVSDNMMTEVFAEELGLKDSFDRVTPTPSVSDIDRDGYLEMPA